MLAAGESSHADCASDSVSANLNQRLIVIFIRDDRGQRPSLNAVARGKRRAAVEEIAAVHAARRSRALRDLLNHSNCDRAVDQSFSAQDAGLARTIVVLCSAKQVKSRRDSSDSVRGTRVTYYPACIKLRARFGYFIAGAPIGCDQRRGSQSQRRQPTRILRVQMKRRRPNCFLIAKNVFEELVF